MDNKNDTAPNTSGAGDQADAAAEAAKKAADAAKAAKDAEAKTAKDLAKAAKDAAKQKIVHAVCLEKCQHNGVIVNEGDPVTFAGGIPEAKKHLFEVM